MKVEEGKKVTLDYTITTDKGEHIESSSGRGEPLKFVFGGQVGLPVGVIEQLEGMEQGAEKEFDLPPEKAFGRIEDGPTMPLPKEAFPKGAALIPGSSFEGTEPRTNQTVKFVLLEDLGENVKVRLINPWAGKSIHIKVKVLAVEEP